MSDKHQDNSHLIIGAALKVSAVAYTILGIGLVMISIWVLDEPPNPRSLTSFVVILATGSATLGRAVNLVHRWWEFRKKFHQVSRKDAANTATWVNPDGKVLEVRYCPMARHYHVTGSLAAGWDLFGEVWPDTATLTYVLIEAQRDGYVPVDDEPTRLIRSRLKIPGWDVTTP